MRTLHSLWEATCVYKSCMIALALATAIGSPCGTDLDCSLNGLCDNMTKACRCDPAWKGEACTTLNFVPGRRASGYRVIGDKVWGNISSWGGGSWYDATDKKWYMFA